MNERILKLIDSKNPEHRRQAIKALVKENSGESIKYLAIIYKTDSDPEIRDLAVKAGRYLKTQAIAASKWEGAGIQTPVEEEAEPEDEPDLVPVSGMKQEQAKSYVEQALDASIARDNKRAFELIRKGFQINPNLRYDSYSMGIATGITETDNDTTLAMLGFGDEEVEYLAPDGDEKVKRKRKNSDREEVGWKTALADLGVFYVVSAVSFAISILLALQIMQSQYSGELAGSVSAVGFGIALIYALLYAVGTVIGILILYGAIHLAAKLTGGDGTYTGLIHEAHTTQVIYYIASTILGIFLLVMMPQVFIPGNPSDSAYAAASFGAIQLFGAVVTILLAITWIVMFSKAIGRNYDFSTARGCVTLFLGQVLLWILLFGCSIAFSSTIASALTVPVYR